MAMRHVGAIAVFLLVAGLASAAPFKRGDVNQDGEINIGDPIKALGYIFSSADVSCEDAVDANDDGQTNIADPIWLLSFLFAKGPDPKAPYPGCGDDTSGDTVTCVSFNPQICPPPPPVTVTDCSPRTGLVTGGTLLTISGTGFSGANPRAYLCEAPLTGVRVLSDTQMEATTPPMTTPRTCDLRVTNSLGSATLPQIFTYEPEPPPPCLKEEDLTTIIDQYLGQPICMPSPAWEGDITILFTTYHVVACPPGNTCQDGSPGCEATFNDITADVDFATRKATANFSALSSLPITIGTTNCVADITATGRANLDFALASTQWPGISRISDLSNLVLTIDTLEVSGSGGILCGALSLAAGTLKEQLQTELNNRAPELLEGLRGELVGQYVCY